MRKPNSSRLFAALTASISLALAVTALGFSVAGLAGDNARVSMKAWDRQGHVGDARQWERARSRLMLARRLNPLNADYQADFGHLMVWAAWSWVPASSEYVNARTRAEFSYTRSIGARPSWGYAWASFAENRLLQGKADADFQHALEMSIVLAPWEPWVQKKVAWMGMATWEELPLRMRRLVRESISRTVTLEHFPNEIVRLAAQYNWLEHLKPMLHSKRQLDAMEFVLRQLDSQW